MPVRRRTLRALIGAAAGAVPALSALAQPQTSQPALPAAPAVPPVPAAPAVPPSPAAPPLPAMPATPPAPAAPSDTLPSATSPPGSTIGPESRGVAATERTTVGTGPIRVALLVPPANGIYRRASQALVVGVKAAHEREGQEVTLEIVEIDEDAETLRALYEELKQREFALVIGPLTRSAVSLIADAGPPAVPTLALNQPQSGRLPQNMVGFGLMIESEARQIAAAALEEAMATVSDRRPRAAAIQNSSALGKRSVAAFIERWRDLGGDVYDPIDVSIATPGRVRSLLARVRADVYFVGASPNVAGAVRLAQGGRSLIYGASMLNTGALAGADGDQIGLRSPELDGVRVLDMPWLLQRDHAAVMAYPKPPGLHLELQRLYALGIDAFRLARRLIERDVPVDLDGVTGRLRLDSANAALVERLGVMAEYRDGLLQALTPP
ncbi:MAG: penicillin-binding protein activator [Burkholderiales bacterium]|nr:penicillin-binding protein activator [Burkholderiales bacterium]